MRVERDEKRTVDKNTSIFEEKRSRFVIEASYDYHMILT
jgi:uncharacterized protein (DUF1778 family)